MLLCALLLAVGWPLVSNQNISASVRLQWTYNLKCHECSIINTFNCPNLRTCAYEVRRCLIVSIRLNVRELYVYKNCTSNCTFLYPSETPPEAPRILKTNSFYFVHCCNSMSCNDGGPTNFERDILPDYTIEEELEGTVRLGESTFFLSVASILVSNTLT
ncbi:glycosyl-phosphatidylinositol-anchored molecule-like protein [Eumetopias jubatus]|uniref:glycosyl-phosphatidylinositol-anchored molecule-like protein n=1 Tax=Eumetopias jubatus TaxID=34886 RepID=UPI00101695A2|nr:glycosyl-phosphatidylinositol-anchored molecule-like protein [Eumetopias jubatus]